MRALFAILAVVAMFELAGCSRSKEGDNVFNVTADDAAMNAAVAKAKATVGDFVSAYHAQKSGTSEYFVKKPYATPGGGQEHMWIEVLGEEKGVIRGRIANDADETREVKLGQIVTLKTSEISDWKYMEGKKLVGGYTIRYFVGKMSPKEREAFLKEAGFEL